MNFHQCVSEWKPLLLTLPFQFSPTHFLWFWKQSSHYLQRTKELKKPTKHTIRILSPASFFLRRECISSNTTKANKALGQLCLTFKAILTEENLKSLLCSSNKEGKQTNKNNLVSCSAGYGLFSENEVQNLHYT